MTALKIIEKIGGGIKRYFRLSPVTALIISFVEPDPNGRLTSFLANTGLDRRRALDGNIVAENTVFEQVGSMSVRISAHPDICGGRPVVRGTRITVPTVLEFLAAGDSPEDLLDEYPSLARADIQACLDYASRLMGNRYSIATLV